MPEAALAFLLLGSAIGFVVRRWRARLQSWQKAAASCGLQVDKVSYFSGLTARAGPLVVRIGDLGKNNLTCIVVTVHGPLDFHNVRIRPEPFIPWGREIEIGDPLFDATFFIEGPVPLVFALLDQGTRRLLLDVGSECRLNIFRSALQAHMSNWKVSKILPLLVDIGQRFAQLPDIPHRLAENANWDTEAGVRLQNLLVLVRELPGEPATVEALRKACSDASPGIRLRAAKELGAEGRATLLKLAESNVDDTVGAEAMLIVGRELPVERTRAILDRALAAGRIQTARVCLEVLGRSGAAANIETLAKVVEYEKAELAVAAVQALEAIGSLAEPSLILALQREERDVRMAAASALGRVGSVAAVLPLKEAAEHASRGVEIQHAARLAIAEIQSRLQGASPGQLSLAGTEAGQLSLAEEAGQLSLATDTGGQLSFPSEEPGQLSPGGDGVD